MKSIIFKFVSNLPLPQAYIAVLQRRDFFVLSSMIFFGQLATAILMLSLIVSVFSKTGSTYGVSGVILSFTLPALFLMAVAGLATDTMDRKKIMLASYILISLVVVFILMTHRSVFASIPLAFLYFAGNTFFIPASSAATAQVVKKEQLLIANSIFVFILSATFLGGFFIASVVNFFFGSTTALGLCAILLFISIIAGVFLPTLNPTVKNHPTFSKTLESLWRGFILIIKARIVWFFFVMFALMQGVIFFGVTLAPGFFTEIVGISIDKSPMFILPFVGLGVLAGVSFVHKPEISEGFLVTIGLSMIGISSSILGIILKFNLVLGSLLFYMVIYLIFIGFGAIVTLIASRTVLQKKVPHGNLGIIFGSNMILTSLLATFMSPLAALLESLIGYINVLIYGGLVFLFISAVYAYFGNRWKY